MVHVLTAVWRRRRLYRLSELARGCPKGVKCQRCRAHAAAEKRLRCQIVVGRAPRGKEASGQEHAVHAVRTLRDDEEALPDTQGCESASRLRRTRTWPRPQSGGTRPTIAVAPDVACDSSLARPTLVGGCVTVGFGYWGCDVGCGM